MYLLPVYAKKLKYTECRCRKPGAVVRRWFKILKNISPNTPKGESTSGSTRSEVFNKKAQEFENTLTISLNGLKSEVLNLKSQIMANTQVIEKVLIKPNQNSLVLYGI